jgi:hypothetical protein
MLRLRLNHKINTALETPPSIRAQFRLAQQPVLFPRLRSTYIGVPQTVRSSRIIMGVDPLHLSPLRVDFLLNVWLVV